MFRASKTHFLVQSRHWGDFSFYAYSFSFSFFRSLFCISWQTAWFFCLYWFTNGDIFFCKKNCTGILCYFIGKLRRFSSLTGLNCFRKVVSKSEIRTPLHTANSASKSLKSQRWISRKIIYYWLRSSLYWKRPLQ
jgi:hypothetical protein